MSPRKNSGVAPLIVVAVLAVLGGVGLFAFKPKALHKASQNAETSTEATAALIEATKKQGAEAAASVVKIGEANAQLPGSALTTFIAKEVALTLTKLPAPDAQALLAAEQRKVAVLEGKVDTINILYGDALKRADELEQARQKAVSARQAADLKLEQAAAEQLGAERQRNQMIVLVVVVVVLYLYVKFTHFSPSAIAGAIADIRKGTYADPVTALDVKATPLQQSVVNFLHRFNHGTRQ